MDATLQEALDALQAVSDASPSLDFSVDRGRPDLRRVVQGGLRYVVNRGYSAKAGPGLHDRAVAALEALNLQPE